MTSVPKRSLVPSLLLTAAGFLVIAPSTSAQDAEPWTNASEVSFVQTGGNAESATFGIANTLARDWGTTQFKLELGGIRTSTTTFTRLAVGSAEDFQLSESEDSKVSAENYYGRVRVDRQISERSALFAKAGWLRNTFAGIDARYVSVLGLSNQWVDTETQKFGTAYGITYTNQDDVVPDPAVASNFLGAQVSVEFWRQITENSEWTSALVLDENGDRTEDFRADWVNSLAVAMSDNLALKTTLLLLFDNQPSLVNVPLESAVGDPIGTVAVPLDEFDRVLTVALVISF